MGISNRPRAFLTMQLENENPFRVVVELRPDLAPTLVDNFLRLCKGTKEGRGYKGSKVLAVLSRAASPVLEIDKRLEDQRHIGGPKAWRTKKLISRRSLGNQTTWGRNEIQE